MLKELDFKTFSERSEAGAVVPVYREFLADMETPVSVLNKFKDDEEVFLLESVEGSERWARYSFIGVNPYAILMELPDRVVIEDKKKGRTELPGADGLTELKKILNTHKLVETPDLPPLTGGAIGYVAYDAVRKFEPSVELEFEKNTPLLCFMLTDEMIIFDNVRHTIIISVCTKPCEFMSLREAYDSAIQKIEELHKRLNTHVPQPDIGEEQARPMKPFKPEMTCEEFKEEVEAAKKAIYEGECIQIVMSQKFTTEAPASALQLYRALRLINPSPYTFFTKFGGRTLIGASPEELVKLTGRTGSVRPIAGTRPRGKTEQQDIQLAADMLNSEKERAEHVMLVDLGRNDIGRVAAKGAVQVKEFMIVERYSHVMHLVSHVEAEIDEKYDCFDLFRAAFPAGTLSGAPKIRAMQLIAKHEHSPRGIYGGAAGYFSYSGNMDFAIVIRTMILEGDTLTMRAGAGIVADSVPEDEYQETLNKSRAVFKAAELAAKLN